MDPCRTRCGSPAGQERLPICKVADWENGDLRNFRVIRWGAGGAVATCHLRENPVNGPGATAAYPMMHHRGDRKNCGFPALKTEWALDRCYGHQPGIIETWVELQSLVLSLCHWWLGQHAMRRPSGIGPVVDWVEAAGDAAIRMRSSGLAWWVRNRQPTADTGERVPDEHAKNFGWETARLFRDNPLLH